MAVVSSIGAGSKPTAAQMNLLWAEFDRKLTKILHGKSFLLSRMGQFPVGLMGKIFYFTPSAADTVYSGRAPGRTTGTGLVIGGDGNPQYLDLQPVPYDHSIFTAALATVAADIVTNPTHASWDDANRIVTVPRIPNTAYGGLPSEILYEATPAMGFCDHSLAAHTMLHLGTGDTTPQPYFVRETGAVPEKIYDYALAELVIEGQSTLDIPDSYNKYNCFRIHNLSQAACVVSFSTHYSVTVAPYGCATVRRDGVTENYRAGWNYFFKFEAGDPRMFWFHCTQQNLPSSPSQPLIGGSTQMRVSNSMTASNLTNPAMIHDWIGAMAIPDDWLARYSAVQNAGWGAMNLGGTNDVRYAWFVRDPSVVYDAHAPNAGQFGDPSDSGTLLGDLIHHQGTIIIARTDRTTIDPASGKLQVTWESMQFRGYATIVADFAAHGITVAENSDGDLTFANARTDICDLIPVGTNLFKRWDATNGETFPTLITLHDQYDNNTPYGGAWFTADCQIFESMPAGISPLPFTLGNQAPPAVFQRNLQTTADSRSYTDYTDPTDSGHTETVTGPSLQNIVVPNPVATRVLHAIHRTTVADILSLVWWGNPALSDQGTDYVTFSNKELTLTDQGLVLSFDTTITGIEPTGSNTGLALSGDLLYWRTGKLTRKQVITFRGHGWGHTAVGSKSMAFMAARSGKRRIQCYIANEVSGPGGADFGVQPVGSSQTTHKVLQRMRLSDLGLPDKTCRFWRNTGRDLDVFLKNYQTPGWYGTVHSPPSGSGDLASPRYTNYYHVPINMLALTSTDVFLLPLDVEHYNGMAAAVNSLATGYGLTCAALAWRVGSQVLSLTPTVDTVPVPMDCFAAFPGGESSQSFGSGNADTLALCQALGLTIRTTLPDDVGSFTKVPQSGCVRFIGTISSFACTACDAGAGTITLTWEGNLAMSRIDAGAQAAGGGPATWNPTTTKPTPGAVGEYYVCSSAGWDGAEFWMKGDLLASLDGATWTHVSSNAGQAGSAVVAQTGLGVQLTPEPPAPAFGHLCAAHSLGTWTPPTLPAAAAHPGDYWTIGSTVRPNYFAGSRIVWDGTGWQVGNSSYADFNWVSIADVTAFMAGLGFEMVFNELVIPLNLSFEAATSAVSSTAGSSKTGTVTLYAASFYYDGVTPEPPTVVDAVNSAPLSISPYANFGTGGAGARSQFSTNGTGGWKMRVSPYTLYAAGAKLADVKSYTTNPPDFVSNTLRFFLDLPATTPFDPPGWFCIAGGWTVYIGDPVYAVGLAFGASLSVGGPGDLYGGMAPGGNDLLFQCGISEDPGAYWQYAQYGLLCQNSTGTDPASTFTIVPRGLWNHDGDYWEADAWSLEKAAIYGVAPYKHFGAAGAPAVVTPGNGLTMLPAPAGSGADLLFNIQVNAIALD